MTQPIYWFHDLMIKKYGRALYRIPVDLGTGCPNRDEKGSGGCSFCSQRAGRSMQTLNQDALEDQLTEAVRFAEKRYQARQFMAYIQAYTANFSEKYQDIYAGILKKKFFKAISFGARPDCLDDSAYEYLRELNKTTDVWVELGVQTVHDKTLKRLNRGHDWETGKNAILKLKSLGLSTIAHVILGLPGETVEEMLATAREISELPVDAVKIHNLHVIKGTQLAKEYAGQPFKVYDEHEYAELLTRFLSQLTSEIAVVRLTTDSLKDEIVAPIWHMNKSHFREYIIRLMPFKELSQGCLSVRQTAFKPYETLDGAVTYFSPEFKEHFHNRAGARLEAVHKFVVPANLLSYKQPVKVLDICFGLGYNSLATLDDAIKQDINVQVTALEIDKRVVRQSASELLPKNSDSFDWRNCLEKMYTEQAFRTEDHCQQLSLIWGDARFTTRQLPGKSFDVVYLDAFSTQKNAELWTLDFFLKIKAVMKEEAVLLTYSSAIPVRSALIQAGFYVGETEPVAGDRGGTIASLNPEKIKMPLPESDLEKIKTTRGLVYRDPYGVWPGKEILRDREYRIKAVKESY